MCVFSETLLSPSYEVKKANEIKEKQQLMIRVLYWHGQLQIAVCAKAQKIKKKNIPIVTTTTISYPTRT